MSKPIFWWGLVVLAIVSIAAIGGYRSMRKTCCAEELSGDQLRRVQRDAENGNVAAMKRLFFFFEEGEDPVNAKLWLKRAADAGDAEAAMFMYDKLFGSGIVKEKELAVKYLMSAAEHGSPTAQEVLGESYRDGSGVSKNVEYAEYWLRKSALLGDRDGILALCDLALLRDNKNQCEECLTLDTQGLASLDRQSYMAKELVSQRERIARKLKDWDRGSQ